MLNHITRNTAFVLLAVAVVARHQGCINDAEFLAAAVLGVTGVTFFWRA